MRHIKIWALASAVALNMLAFQQQAVASECGLSCCIGAGVDGVGSAAGLTVSLQYDTMYMKTNKQGIGEIAADTIIANELAGRAGMYGVSSKMTMQKIAANLSYRLDEDNAFVLTIPYVINDMDMRMGMKMMAGSPIVYSNSTMETIDGLGDIALLYLRDIYKDAEMRTRQRLSVGVGLKMPTGKSKSRTASGNLVHMMMQAGTGSWDGFLLANGTLGVGEHADGGALLLFLPSVTYQINSRNSLGYKLGNRLNYDLSTRYRLTSSFNMKLDLNGIWSQRDSSDGTIDAASGLVAYQNVTRNVLDNVANTGIHSLFVAPGFQWIAAPGWVISGEYRLPVYQKTNGIQQVTDHWFFLRVTAQI